MTNPLSAYLDTKTIATITGLLTVLGGGAYEGKQLADASYASQEDIQLVELRLDQKILSDRLRDVEQRLWDYESRYGEDLSKWSDDRRNEYKRLKSEREQILEDLKVLKEHTLLKKYGKS